MRKQSLRSSARILVFLVLTVGLAVAMNATVAHAADDARKDAGLTLNLNGRVQVETKPGSGRYHTLSRRIDWNPKKTAVVICDMWDKHWCPASTARVGEMASRMNAVVNKARKQGALIVHCPSGCMDYYKDTPQRQLALQAPKVETKVALKSWCHLDKDREGGLPIDDSDGGCDTLSPPKSYRAWARQIAAIEIKQGDAIADDAQVYYLMRQKGITNVIVMGVHTNMCVLGRPFSIRQMIYQGQNVVLMRDMTDTMYNPRMSPFVSHFTGTDLVVSHIEKSWCPTITSADFLGGKEFRFQEDKRKHIAIVMAEQEYDTNRTLPVFALKHLGNDFRVSYIFANEKDRNDIPGLEALQQADVAFISVRRRVPTAAQLNIVRKFIAAGKPVIGIRTASHAFALRKGDAPQGHAAWPQFDHDVIGGNYSNHHGNGPKVAVKAASGAAGHSILSGVKLDKLAGNGSLYVVSPLTKSTTALVTGTIPGKPSEPIAWTNARKDGGRTFYTSFGHPDDFKNPAFNRLLRNGVYWAAGLPTNQTSKNAAGGGGCE